MGTGGARDAGELARELLSARVTGAPLGAVPRELGSADLDFAYRVQDAFVARLAESGGGRPIGYKIGLTTAAAQQALQVDRPIHGRLLSSFCHASPGSLAPQQFFMRAVEAEIAFRMGADLLSGSAGASIPREAVIEAVAAVLPSIEIADSRYRPGSGAGAAAIVADNAFAGHWVHGADTSAWRDLDLPGLGVRLFVDGQRVREGTGAAVLGDPVNALVYLANALARRGGGLRKGDVVSAGSLTAPLIMTSGRLVEADFDGLGRVEVVFG